MSLSGRTRTFVRRGNMVVATFALSGFLASAVSVTPNANELDEGYRAMYNLDFGAAHKAIA